MCRRNQLLSLFLIGLGAGLVIACRVSSPFWCSCLGFGVVILGVFFLQKNTKCS